MSNVTAPAMTAPCPHCGREYDLTYRMRGDRVWCRCGKWFLVSFLLNGAPYLVKVAAPEGLLDKERDQ